MNPYKCDKHKLDFACLGCIKAWIARHDKLLEFVREISGVVHKGNCRDLGIRAENLLKEIGKSK